MKLILSPIHNTLFVGRIWMGLDVEKIADCVKTISPSCTTQIISFDQVALDLRLLPQGCYWFYSVSYNSDYQQFVRDVAYNVSVARRDVIMIPNLDQLFSFENKGYQELLKQRLGISRVPGRYYGDSQEMVDDAVKFPFVFKSLKGSMSSGVKLVQNQKEWNEIVQQEKKLRLIDRIRQYRKKRKMKDYVLEARPELSRVNFGKFFSKRSPFVRQDFIKDLQYDYKVLIFHDKYFILRRLVRKNDFRASGSGMFEWVEPPLHVLSFSKEVFLKMNVPFISFDISEANGDCDLIEFQGIGFGPLTLINSPYYFVELPSGWTKIDGRSNLEEEYAKAIIAMNV